MQYQKMIPFSLIHSLEGGQGPSPSEIASTLKGWRKLLYMLGL